MFPWLPLVSSTVSTPKHQTTVRSKKKGVRFSTSHQSTKRPRSVRHPTQITSPLIPNGMKPQKGLPWRTAARSLKHWYSLVMQGVDICRCHVNFVCFARAKTNLDFPAVGNKQHSACDSSTEVSECLVDII